MSYSAVGTAVELRALEARENQTQLAGRYETMRTGIGTTLLAAAFAVVALTACEEKGAFERAGEEIDEAADSVREGGETTEAKVDDAIDDLREGAEDAADELRDNN